MPDIENRNNNRNFVANQNQRCVYCGNNPVPHLLNWYNESLSILLTPLRQWLLYNALSRWIKKRKLGKGIGALLERIGENLKIIRRQDDIAKCKVARAKVLWEEAEKRGIKMSELLFFGKPFDTYIAEKGCRVQGTGSSGCSLNAETCTLFFSGLPRPTGYSNSILDVMDDKWLFKQIMVKNNLPVPKGEGVWNFRQAKKIFREIKKPAIVKPRTGSRGRHSTTFVCSEKDLRQAFKVAKQLCFWVMVEEQLEGPVYRATVIDFKLAGVLRGDPPQVQGDGASSISLLIEKKNQAPHHGVKNIVISKEVERFVARELQDKFQISNNKYQINFQYPIPNFQLKPENILEYIPVPGETVNLSEKIGVNYGGSSSEDFEICHEDNKELFVAAAKVLKDPIVGFDFIIPDITKSYKEQNCGFIEANSLPFINLHHDPLLGKPRNVAAKVWEMIGW